MKLYEKGSGAFAILFLLALIAAFWKYFLLFLVIFFVILGLVKLLMAISNPKEAKEDTHQERKIWAQTLQNCMTEQTNEIKGLISKLPERDQKVYSAALVSLNMEVKTFIERNGTEEFDMSIQQKRTELIGRMEQLKKDCAKRTGKETDPQSATTKSEKAWSNETRKTMADYKDQVTRLANIAEDRINDLFDETGLTHPKFKTAVTEARNRAKEISRKADQICDQFQNEELSDKRREVLDSYKTEMEELISNLNDLVDQLLILDQQNVLKNSEAIQTKLTELTATTHLYN